jgi:hypothetical protein
MSDLAPSATERLIGRLARDLRPVPVLPSPWRRAALWLGAALWFGAFLGIFADFGMLRERLMAVPDMALSQAGAVLTAVLGALAAFQTSVPGRSPHWAWLPLPAAALWLGASTAGCLRLAPIAGTVPEPAMHPAVCLWFLLLAAMPMALLLVFMLIRACPLRPALTASLGGLASAAAAAALLALIHPFDANAADLLMHGVAVVIVVAATRWLGASRLRQGKRKAGLLF